MNKKMETIKLLIERIKEPLLAVLVAIILIPSFLVSNTRVPTESMVPAIYPGDHLLVSQLPYYYRDPLYGEVIVFKYGKDYLIKRVIAGPGDTIHIVENKVYLNDQLLDESSYLQEEMPTYLYTSSKIEFPYTVPENSYFVMGDNRLNSKDSRFFGAVHRSNIIAKAEYRIWPIKNIGPIK